MRSRRRSPLLALLTLVLFVALTYGQGTLPESRWGQAATVIGNILLIHGGKTDPDNSYSYTSAPNTAQLLSLDLSTSFSLDSPPWTTVYAPNTPALAFHTITSYSMNELLLFGGDGGPDLALSTRNDSAGTLWLSGNANATWTTRPDGWAGQPMRRIYHSANSYNGKVVITGGERADGSHSAFREPYVFQSWTASFSEGATDNGPPDLVGHAAITLPNGTMLLFGGHSESAAQLQPLNTIYTYNHFEGTWSSFTTQGDVVPEPRRNFAAVLVGSDSLIIHGGTDGENPRGNGFMFSLLSQQWRALPALGTELGARWDHSAFAVGQYAFFVYGYSSEGPASNALKLYDSQGDMFLAAYDPPGGNPNTNSPIIYPPSNNNNGGGDNHGNGNNGNTGNTTPTGDSNTGNNSPSHPSGGHEPSRSKTPVVIGSIFGVLGAIAVLVVIIIVYRRRNDRHHKRGWSGHTEESEKAVMVGGFEAVPRGRGYGFVTKLLNIKPTAIYTQAPRRDRFDILGDEEALDAAARQPRARRTGTSGSGNSWRASRWSSFGGAPSAIGSLVNASVSSLRSVFGIANIASPTRDYKEDSYPGVGSTRKAAVPPSAWRRGSSYVSNNRVDPFGDEFGVEEEYQRAMALQHERLKRASTSGPDDYSALILNRQPSDLQPVAETSRAGAIGYFPLATVPSVPSAPSESHGSESHTTHNTTIRTPAAESSHYYGSPRVHSPTLHPKESQLQRATSGGSRLGVTLTRTLSALSSLFNSSEQGHARSSRGRHIVAPPPYEYIDLRDPNPPPPMLGLGLIPIKEAGSEDGSRHVSRIVNYSEAGSNQGTGSTRPPLVLKALHGKSLSSLRTANSEALERLGTGNWDVIQRDDTTSSRRTGATSGSESQFTDLGEDVGSGWKDIVGRPDNAYVASPVDLNKLPSPEQGTPNERAATVPIIGTNAPTGPRPIPPPKRVTYNLAQRIDALGLPDQPSTSLSRGPSPPQEPTSPRRAHATYGLVQKPTLFVANPEKRGRSDAS
ncbi:galactose oxidase [Serendipita vermifera]|nr:galactose oxidase [Serendipita vermifera]